MARKYITRYAMQESLEYTINSYVEVGWTLEFIVPEIVHERPPAYAYKTTHTRFHLIFHDDDSPIGQRPEFQRMFKKLEDDAAERLRK